VLSDARHVLLEIFTQIAALSFGRGALATATHTEVCRRKAHWRGLLALGRSAIHDRLSLETNRRSPGRLCNTAQRVGLASVGSMSARSFFAGGLTMRLASRSSVVVATPSRQKPAIEDRSAHRSIVPPRSIAEFGVDGVALRPGQTPAVKDTRRIPVRRSV